MAVYTRPLLINQPYGANPDLKLCKNPPLYCYVRSARKHYIPAWITIPHSNMSVFKTHRLGSQSIHHRCRILQFTSKNPNRVTTHIIDCYEKEVHRFLLCKSRQAKNATKTGNKTDLKVKKGIFINTRLELKLITKNKPFERSTKSLMSSKKKERWYLFPDLEFQGHNLLNHFFNGLRIIDSIA